MSEEQSLAQPISGQSLPQPQRKLTLLNSLIILAIIYLVCEIIPLFVTLVAQSLVPWIELGQWVLIVIWLLVGVRPPFMHWLKQTRHA